MAELLPEDYEPQSYQSRASAGRELEEAATLGRENPGRWIVVGEPRALSKPPSSWLSEVNLGKKECLNRAGERWEAKAEVVGTDGKKDVYRKMIRLIPA